MTDDVALEELAALSIRGGTIDFARLGGDDLLRGLAVVLEAELAVRLSVVGYGHAIRVALTDKRGWSCGWTVATPEELHSLWRGLCAPGGLDYVARLLEKPKRGR